jgi:protein-disulfide isomerase
LVFAIVAGVGCGDAADTPAPPAAAPAAAPSAPPAAAPAAPPVAQAAEPERFRIPVTPAEPARGADAPRVTIVEFSDFQCPFCTRVEPTIEAVLKEYDGKVRVVWRNNPLPMHPNAIPAAEAAMAAFAQGGNEKFWAMHGKLFANQQALGRPDLERYAGELGLDLDSFKQALDQRAAQKQIAADQALAQRMGASATPAFFVNGRFLSGAQPLEAFKTVIDDELQRAEKLTASGTSPSDLYDALTKNGLEAAQPKAAAPARPQQDPAAVYKVPVDKAPQQGPSDALVTIVEFSDYQCPFSRKAQPTLAQIIQTYGKDVRHVYRNNPLAMHNHAALAAEAALAARDQDKFWEYHDRLFANQQALAREDLEQYATELGLDMAKFKAALDTNAHKDEIAADQQLTRSLGQTGTPAFFVNGRSVKGARPFDAFKALIDEELQKARDLVAKGTPQDQVYGKIIENGATAPKFLEGAAAAAAAAAAAPPPPDPNKIYALTVPADAPARGSPDARVVIQEFADFQCPFCGRVSPTVKQVMQEYGDSVRFVWRNYPLRFHANAQKASEAAVEVQAQGGEEKFWQYHDLLLQNQNALTPQDLVRYAEQIGGIDTQALKAALDSDKHKARVQADVDAIGAAGAQIGTPSFFINGKLLQGALPMESFKAAIDKAMAEAK